MRLSLLVVGTLLLVFGGLRAPPGLRAEESEDVDEIEVVLTEPLPLEDFLKAVGMVSRITFVWDPGATAVRTAELVSARNLRASREAFMGLVRGLLASYDLGLVPIAPNGHAVYRVVDLKTIGAGAGLRLKPVTVELTDDLRTRLATQDGLYVTATVPAPHLTDLETAARVLGAMATGHGIGQVIGLPEAGALVVTDFAPALVRIANTIDDLDARARRRAEQAEATGSPDVYEVVILEHADASDLAQTLVAQFAANGPRVDTDGTWLRIHADARTNALLVSGTPARTKRIVAALQQLDHPTRETATWTHVLRLEHIQAREAALALEKLLTDVRIVAHAETNALLVTATPQAFEQLKAIVEDLDNP